MRRVDPANEDLARRLLSLEVGPGDPAGPGAALSIVVKLCAYLAKLIGVAGVQAILSRALALARTEVRWLAAVRVTSGATLEDFSETALQQSPEAALEGGMALISHLLDLLATFIGDGLVKRLLQDVWPGAELDTHEDAEGTPT